MTWGEGGRENFLLFLECLSGSETGEFRTLNAFAPTTSVLAIPNNRNSGIHPITKLRIELSADID